MVQVSRIGVEDRTHEDPGAYVLVRSLWGRKHAGCVKHESIPFHSSRVPHYDYHHFRIYARQAYTLDCIVIVTEEGRRTTLEQWGRSSSCRVCWSPPLRHDSAGAGAVIRSLRTMIF